MLVRHDESDRMSDLRRGIELPDPGDPLRFVKEQLGALNARLRLGML